MRWTRLRWINKSGAELVPYCLLPLLLLLKLFSGELSITDYWQLVFVACDLVFHAMEHHSSILRFLKFAWQRASRRASSTGSSASLSSDETLDSVLRELAVFTRNAARRSDSTSSASRTSGAAQLPEVHLAVDENEVQYDLAEFITLESFRDYSGMNHFEAHVGVDEVDEEKEDNARAATDTIDLTFPAPTTRCTATTNLRRSARR